VLLLLKWDVFQVGTFREFILFDSDQAVVLLLHLFEGLCAWLTAWLTGISCFYSSLQALVGGNTTIRHNNTTITTCLECFRARLPFADVFGKRQNPKTLEWQLKCILMQHLGWHPDCRKVRDENSRLSQDDLSAWNTLECNVCTLVIGSLGTLLVCFVRDSQPGTSH